MDIGKNTVIVILVVAFLAVGAYVYINTFAKDSQTISVSGDSEISAEPELAVIYLNIETLEDSADESKDKNAEISGEVMNALRALRIDEDDIETISYNINPDYSWENNRQVLKGYRTENNIKVKLEDFDDVGIVVDRTVDVGAFVRSINFELSPEKENELKAKAIEEATKDAKNKAQAVAKGSGRSLGKLVSVSTNSYYYRPYMAYEYYEGASVSDMKQAATQISPKDLQITASIQAVYKLK